MDKKVIIAGSVALVVLGLVTGWFFLRSQKETTVSPVAQEGEVTSSLLPSKTLKEYKDEAGFTFQHPEDVTVIAREINDTATYSDLEISSSKAPGKLTFKAADTKLTSLDLSSGKDILLGGLSAKEIASDGNIESVALDQGVLFTITVEGGKQKAFWQSVYETLLSTFAFVQVETSQGLGGAAGGSSADIIFEGEEVIE